MQTNLEHSISTLFGKLNLLVITCRKFFLEFQFLMCILLENISIRYIYRNEVRTEVRFLAKNDQDKSKKNRTTTPSSDETLALQENHLIRFCKSV